MVGVAGDMEISMVSPSEFDIFRGHTSKHIGGVKTFEF